MTFVLSYVLPLLGLDTDITVPFLGVFPTVGK